MTNRNQPSTRFRDEIRVLSEWVFALAAVVFIAVVVLMVIVLGKDRHAPPLAVRYAFGIAVGTVMACYIVLIGFVNRDAGQRRMSRLWWTLIAIFVPNGLGIVLYFILRKPRPVHCPQCEAEVEPGFSFCPRCSNRLQPICTHCQRSVDATDKFCPYCGDSLTSGSGAPPAMGIREP
jgi:RNA polymerase subunit RPABC4/transcription elongation factor Spt4